MDSVGCIACLDQKDLFDAFTPYNEKKETYAELLKKCFHIQVLNKLTLLCIKCIYKLREAFDLKNTLIQKLNAPSGHRNNSNNYYKDIEYLDETLFRGEDKEGAPIKLIISLEMNSIINAGAEATPATQINIFNNPDASAHKAVNLKNSHDTKRPAEVTENGAHSLRVQSFYTTNIKDRKFSLNLDIQPSTETDNNNHILKKKSTPAKEPLLKAAHQNIDKSQLTSVAFNHPINANGREAKSEDTDTETSDGQSDIEEIVTLKSEMDEDFDDSMPMDIETDVTDQDIDDIEEEYTVQTLDETTCVYCGVSLGIAALVDDHVRSVHALDPRTGDPLRECAICGVTIIHSYHDHYNRCHSSNPASGVKKYQCLFCDKIYTNMKAYFTHLRMKHGLKLSNDQTPKYAPRERQKCHLCERDFSQKQILNKHLLKAHGFEVEKRKAYICPLCSERVSYGVYFTEHLWQQHQIKEEVEYLEFLTMDDFMLFKTATQEDTKVRYRKTTASKPTIEGMRSHYMCSQSGVYVYQGKGKRPAPERQIYKTGKACPAHMIVTETLDRVQVVFHKTHIGHGACPYYEPRHTFATRKPRMMKTSTITEASMIYRSEETEAEETTHWVCDTCGMVFADPKVFRLHITSHKIMFPCQYCGAIFQDTDAWACHTRISHGVNTVLN